MFPNSFCFATSALLGEILKDCWQSNLIADCLTATKYVKLTLRKSASVSLQQHFEKMMGAQYSY